MEWTYFQSYYYAIFFEFSFISYAKTFVVNNEKFEIIDTKKRIDENKIVKATKKAHVGKIKSFLIDAVKIINPIHWFKKLVVNSTISFATRKISLIIIDIVADESNKTYSKKIFDKEKSIREMEIEQILEELEKEEQDA